MTEDPGARAPMELRAPFKVHSYQVGADDQLTARALCNYLQEAAGTHARLLGVSMERLGLDGLAWVLRRLRVRQPDPVGRGTQIEVQTWPSRFDRIVAHRHFIVRDSDGAELVRAVSEWVMVDLTRRSVARIPEWVRQLRVPQQGSALEFEGRTLGKVDPGEGDDVRTLAARVPHAAIDVLGHVTNSQYVEWLQEPLEEAFLASHRLVEIDIQFQRESLRGETLSHRAWRGDGPEGAVGWLHRIDGPEGEERVRARTFWRLR